MKYFAYASNMSPARMKEKGIHFIQAEPAKIRGWKMEFVKAGELPGQGYATIVAAEETAVLEGVLYEIQESELAKLDVWEKCPAEYQREFVQAINGMDATFQAVMYRALPQYLREGLRPTRQYLDWILGGKNFLSADYYRKLATVKTL